MSLTPPNPLSSEFTDTSIVSLSLTLNQAKAVSQSLDLLTRMGLGQMRAIADQVRHGSIPLNRDAAPVDAVAQTAADRYDAIDDLCAEMSRQLGFSPNVSYGIGNEQVPMAARRAYEIGKVLDKALALYRDPAPAFRGVNYDGLTVRYTDDPAPVAAVETASPAKTLSDTPAVRVPVSVINAITAYGDARADGDIALGGERLADCIRAVREAMSCKQSSIRMTSDRPTAPGWYWYALPGEWAMQPVLVSLYEGELYYCRDAISQNGPEDGFLLSGCNAGSLWSAEPIPAPGA